MAELVGKKAPGFVLQGSDGKAHSPGEYAGKTVILYFYPKDHTPGCTKEACGFRDLGKQFSALDAVVIGVSRDGPSSHDRFVKDFHLPFVLLSDPDAKTMAAYGAWGEKTMYGKKVTGTIRSTVVIGPDGKVRKHWRTVRKAAEHPAEVLAFLRER